MTKSPFTNALGALGYILIAVTVMNFIMKTQGSKPDTIMAPITLLSMLTLSTTVMACMFFYQPLLYFIDGKKRQAMGLFIKTVGVFAILTTLVLLTLFSGAIK